MLRPDWPVMGLSLRVCLFADAPNPSWRQRVRINTGGVGPGVRFSRLSAG